MYPNNFAVSPRQNKNSLQQTVIHSKTLQIRKLIVVTKIFIKKLMMENLSFYYLSIAIETKASNRNYFFWLVIFVVLLLFISVLKIGSFCSRFND